MLFETKPIAVQTLYGVMQLERRCFTSHLRWEPKDVAEFFSKPEADAFVAVYDEQVIGTVWLDRIQPDTIEIGNLAVVKEHRQQGVGAALLARAIEFATSEGVRHLELDVAIGNRRAQRLYERLGFRLAHRTTDYYGPGKDAYRYRAEMTASAL